MAMSSRASPSVNPNYIPIVVVIIFFLSFYVGYIIIFESDEYWITII